MAIVHPVGKLVNECEKYVVKQLAAELPDSFHVYHNLEFTPYQSGGHPYEYDVVVVEPEGVWTLEVKGYNGKIAGNAKQWRLANGKVVHSPIPLNNLKARVLKNSLEPATLELKNLYVDAYVVLCHQVQLNIDDPQATRVLHVADFIARLKKRAAYTGHDDPSRPIRDFLDKRFKPLVSERQIGEYTIEGPAVRRSKYSVTYPARHTLLKVRNRVSLKLFRLNVDQSTNGREQRKKLFLRNADVLGILGEFPHKNIARCYPPFLWESDTLALPLEWIDGPTLHDLLQEGKEWSFRQRLRIFKQIGRGLEHAHRLGVIHRTLSPKNVIILARNNVKLVNFNFAKVDPALFTTTMDRVTQRLIQEADWRYTAPELRILGGTVTPAADVFSAGVLLYELMTRRCPFKKRPIKQSDSLPRPSQVNGELPPQIDDLFLHMCVFDPPERIQTMAEVLQHLQEI